MIAFFINISWIDVIDIIIVAILIYYFYQLVKGTAAINIFFGILIIYIVYLIVDAIQLKLLSKILGQFIGIGVLALVIVFQQEIRRFLLLLGTTWFNNRYSWIRKILPKNFSSSSIYQLDTKELETSLKVLLHSNTGALIVILKNSELKYYVRTGVPIEAKVTNQLIQNIFFKNSPLHDGAIFIKNNIIVAARCILPITEKQDFPENLGLRHRAAVGITEMSDAIAIVVSEQNQQFSISYRGEINYNVSLIELIKRLNEYLKPD